MFPAWAHYKDLGCGRWSPRLLAEAAAVSAGCTRGGDVCMSSFHGFCQHCPDVSSHGVHEDRWLFLRPHSVAEGRGWARALDYGNTPPPARRAVELPPLILPLPLGSKPNLCNCFPGISPPCLTPTHQTGSLVLPGRAPGMTSSRLSGPLLLRPYPPYPEQVVGPCHASVFTSVHWG